MKILHVKGTNLFDVFQGSGWKHWTRVLVVEKKKLALIQGLKIQEELLTVIFSMINEKHKYA